MFMHGILNAINTPFLLFRRIVIRLVLLMYICSQEEEERAEASRRPGG